MSSGSFAKQARKLASDASAAATHLARADSQVKNDALNRMAELLRKGSAEVQGANKKDLAAAAKAGLSSAMIDRLTLSRKRVEAMASALEEIADLPDPVGEMIEGHARPGGFRVDRVRVPLGVVLAIYESRPNVTSDIAGLCLKAGNGVILRGGSEAIHSNRAVHKVLVSGLKAARLPAEAIQLVRQTDHGFVSAMLKLDDLIDVVIPRGGEGLIRAVVRRSSIPVIKHYKGVCHVYVDEFADLAMARAIAMNAKVQRPGVCNAMETLLVHQAVAEKVLPKLCRDLVAAGVEVRGCARTREIFPAAKRASARDWPAEYLDLILAVKVVADFDEAVEHIGRYGSAHTDAIVTGNLQRADEFVLRVDSSSVMVNASTRLSDGGVYGLGAEVGISTDKLHARGPMGVRDLTTYKWVVRGSGTLRT